MNSFWHALWICMVVIPVTLLWAAAVFDIVWRRGDLIWWKRLSWLLAVIFLPLIGVFIYALVGLGREDSTAMTYHDIEELHERGVLTDAEYQEQRENLDRYAHRR